MNNKNLQGEQDQSVEQLESFEGQKLRNLSNRYTKLILSVILGLITVAGILYILRIHQRLGISIYKEQYIGLFLGLVLCAVFLCVPATRSAPKDRIPLYDWVLAVWGLFAGLYITINYPKLVMELGIVSTERFVVSVFAIIIVLEAIRRMVGYIMLSIVSIFIIYGFVAPYLPGVFQGKPTSAPLLFNYLYLDPNSMLELLNIAATIALSFILFGQILLSLKGADHFNNFALALFGGRRGGPAKVAIFGSSLVGTITGGPVANVILTGSVTIPLMKRNGYTSSQAGAIESVASTGGQIMPPVMGIAAFIVAETLGIPYTEVALAALIPAILYYVCLFSQVDLMAARREMSALKKEELPSLKNVLTMGWMIIPIFAALIYFLFIKGYTPAIAGIFSAAVAVVLLTLQKVIYTDLWNRLFKVIPEILVESGKSMLEIGVILAAAGIVVGITGVTGLGFNIGYILLSFAEYGSFWLLVSSAIMSVILGMGMPTVAAYSLVAIMVAPALVELGFDPLAAHLFVLYFAIVSNFTPPVALACFAAAPIAKANPYSIGFESMKLGIVAYIVPFIFVYAPELLLRFEPIAPWHIIVFNSVTALFGCYLLSVVVTGFLFRSLTIVKRIFVLILSFCLLLPSSLWQLSEIVNVLSALLAIIFIIIEWKTRNEEKLS